MCISSKVFAVNSRLMNPIIHTSTWVLKMKDILNMFKIELPINNFLSSKLILLQIFYLS